MPILNAALRAVGQLKKNDIDELKNFKTAPPAAKVVAQTLCIMFEVQPAKSGTGKDKIFDYWEPSKKFVFNA